jgi:hypothetical protein
MGHPSYKLVCKLHEPSYLGGLALQQFEFPTAGWSAAVNASAFWSSTRHLHLVGIKLCWTGRLTKSNKQNYAKIINSSHCLWINVPGSSRVKQRAARVCLSISKPYLGGPAIWMRTKVILFLFLYSSPEENGGFLVQFSIVLAQPLVGAEVLNLSLKCTNKPA